jgi:hypothetical protein
LSLSPKQAWAPDKPPSNSLRYGYRCLCKMLQSQNLNQAQSPAICPSNGLHYGYRCLENTVYLDIPINMYFFYQIHVLRTVPIRESCMFPNYFVSPPLSYSFMLILYCTPTSRFLRKVVLMVNLHNKKWFCALKSHHSCFMLLNHFVRVFSTHMDSLVLFNGPKPGVSTYILSYQSVFRVVASKT